MHEQEKLLQLIKKQFVNNGEYNIENEREAEQFARELLFHIEDTYTSEGYYHKYDTLEDFIYTSHADTEAYFLYEEKYS